MLTFDVLLQLAIDGVTRGAMYGLMATGLAFVFGVLRLINMSHGELFMLGAYVMYFVTVALGFHPAVGIIAAACSLFLIGIALERSLISPLRSRLGDQWLIDGYVLTIGIMVVLQNSALAAFGAREYGIAGFWPGRLELAGIVIATDRLLICSEAIVLFTALGLFLSKTDLGRAIRATADHTDAARVLGINARWIYTITFGIGSALAGTVGAMLLATYPAYPTVGGEILLKAFVVVIVGGLGSIWGAMITGPILGIIEAYSTAFASGGWQNTITSVLVLAMLVLRPQGILGRQVTRP
jgi:branched-chain amino acid transport system permease protein